MRDNQHFAWIDNGEHASMDLTNQTDRIDCWRLIDGDLFEDTLQNLMNKVDNGKLVCTMYISFLMHTYDYD